MKSNIKENLAFLECNVLRFQLFEKSGVLFWVKQRTEARNVSE